MSHFQRVLLTGAAGSVGTALRQSGTRLGRIVRLSDRKPCENVASHEEDFPLELADFDAHDSFIARSPEQS